MFLNIGSLSYHTNICSLLYQSLYVSQYRFTNENYESTMNAYTPVTDDKSNNDTLLFLKLLSLFTYFGFTHQNGQKCKKAATKNVNAGRVSEPCGSQVARTESLLLRLLNAVFIPTTMKYFCLPFDSVSFRSSDKGEPLSIDSCVALAAANSISKFDIVLSSDLQLKRLCHGLVRNDIFDFEIFFLPVF